jgi:hypothetical protein
MFNFRRDNMRKILTIILVIMGGIVGVALGNMCTNINGLSWLSIGGEMGLKNPVIIDISFLQVTFGLWLKINIAGIIGIIVFAFLSRKVIKWAKI